MREDARKWRLSIPMQSYRDVRAKFDQAGLRMYLYNVNFNETFTDEERDRTFEAAKALGCAGFRSSVEEGKRCVDYCGEVLSWRAASFSPAVPAAAQTPGKPDAGGVLAPTPELDRGRTVYVLSSCHFCRGADLSQAAMGAANRMHSALVGHDQSGNLIGPIVRAGLPNLQTAMPQYSDYTDQQVRDLAAYIHSLRQQGRYKELTAAATSSPGDAIAGHTYFEANCAKCHAGNLAGMAGKNKAAQLRERFLRPASALVEHPSAGAVTHSRLLENYKEDDVRNVVDYLATLK